MIKKEAKQQVIFNQYLREKRKERFYCYYELKIAKNGYFHFNNIELNQLEGLPATEKEGLVWKFSDQDQRKKPCDGISAPPLPSYIVICFVDTFYMIRIGLIMDMMFDGQSKIGELQAKAAAERVIHIK